MKNTELERTCRRRVQKADAKEEKEARAKIVRQIKPKRSFDYSHITTAKGIPVASLKGIPSWLDLLTDCETAIA